MLFSDGQHRTGGSNCEIFEMTWQVLTLKSVQSALSDLKRPLNVYSPSAIIGLSLLNNVLMARFLKQSFAQTCLKDTDNGKLQQFNYSRSLITNRGTVERGKLHSAPAMKQNTQTLQRIIMHH